MFATEYWTTGKLSWRWLPPQGFPLSPALSLIPAALLLTAPGKMIADALAKGCSDISIAIGGSATNDGGMGCMRALGVRFLDKNGNELAGGGQDLIKIRSIDTAGIYPLVKRASFTIMCDVTNPLCGEKGCHIYIWETKRRHSGNTR